MSQQEQLDKQVIRGLHDAAERVAMGNSPPNHLLDPAARYLARAPVPTIVQTVKSLGRISFGRAHEHEPGIVLFILEEDIADLDGLTQIGRLEVLQPPTENDYASVADDQWSKPDAVAAFLSKNLSDEATAAKHANKDYEGVICNHVLPAVVGVLATIDESYIRWRGPGAEGRVQISEDLEGERGLAVWIHPYCLGQNIQPSDIVELCGAEKRGQSPIMEEIDL